MKSLHEPMKSALLSDVFLATGWQVTPIVWCELWANLKNPLDALDYQLGESIEEGMGLW